MHPRDDDLEALQQQLIRALKPEADDGLHDDEEDEDDGHCDCAAP